MAIKESRLLDKRTIERYREKGLISAGEIQSHLKGLPDSGKDCQWVQMDLHDTEMGDEAGSDVDDDEIGDEDEDETSDENTA